MLSQFSHNFAALPNVVVVRAVATYVVAILGYNWDTCDTIRGTVAIPKSNEILDDAVYIGTSFGTDSA